MGTGAGGLMVVGAAAAVSGARPAEATAQATAQATAEVAAACRGATGGEGSCLILCGRSQPNAAVLVAAACCLRLLVDLGVLRGRAFAAAASNSS